VKPVGIHHVNLLFDDIDAARTFYAETMGFEEIERPDFGFPGLWFRMGEHQLHLSPGAAPNSLQHFALEVEDLDAALADLADRGLVVTPSDPLEGAGRQAFLTDPTGNLIELNQPLP
jgi:catechol 2,3-dioxygenase-like lactoylglutathione lyase family enzyme